MTLPFILLMAALLVPVAGFGGQLLGRSAGWLCSLGMFAIAACLTALWLDRGDASTITHVVQWIPILDVSLALRLDGLSFFFALLVMVIGGVVLAYCARYLHGGGHGVFYALMTFFGAAMLGLVLADDLVLLFVMWEFTTLCSFLLIARSGPAGTEPAIRTFLVTVAGGLCLLTAVAVAWVTTGTTSLNVVLTHPVWEQRPQLTAAVAVLVALAAFTKSAQFPFHGWLPDAMVAITPVSAYLHAAAMVKAGIYLLLRFSTLFHDVPAWNALLVTVGVITAAMGALFALQRHDLKGLLAYSTVSQLGFLVATIGIGTTYAIVGAVVHTAAHALFKSALFMSVGVIDHQAGTRDMRELSGLAKSMPVTAVVMTLAAMSMAGLPPLFGFVTKEAMFKAASQAEMPLGVVVLVGTALVLAASLTFAYSARMILPVFPGPALSTPPREGSPAFLAPVALVSLAGVVLGVAGPLAEPLLTPAAQSVMGEKAHADLGLWHGVNPALMMSLAVIGLGLVLVALRHPIERLLGGRRLLPFTAVGIVDAVRDGSIAFGRRVGDVTRSDAPFGHLAWPLGLLVVLAGGGVLIADVEPVFAPLTRPTDWILLFLVLVGVVLANIAYTRMTMIVVVGVSGFAMSLFFFTLGAVDVALTQLMVEILTVVVIVLVLSRLPDTFHPTGRWRIGIATVLAVLVGAAAGLAAWAFTGRRDLSEVGGIFLAEGAELTGGTNVVNTILVDFRALDTLGEFVVLGVAALAIVIALDGRGLLPYRPSPRRPRIARAIDDSRSNTIVLRVTDRFLGPVLVLLSGYLFLRGHNAPGGGFISALVLGAGIALVYLAAPDDRVSRLSRSYTTLIGWGVVIGVLTGLIGYLDGSFLRPLHPYVAGVKLTTALVFDLAVYLAVAGIILAAISRLGTTQGRPPLRRVGAQDQALAGPGGTVTEPHHPDTAPLLATTAERDRTRAPWRESRTGSTSTRGGR